MRALARNLARSLAVPVYLQDERLTSRAAAEQLRAAGYPDAEAAGRLDSEAAALILQDFLATQSSTSPTDTSDHSGATPAPEDFD